MALGRDMSQIISLSNISDSLDEEARLDVMIIDFSKAFGLVPHDHLLKKTAAWGMDFRVVVWIREFLLGCTQRVKSRGEIIRGGLGDVRERTGPTSVPSLRKRYLEEHRIKN
jgi:hypothetical protein